MMNKYEQKHNNDSNRVLNSHVNKSGHNLAANFTKVMKKAAPQTQRNGTTERSATGRNQLKNSINGTTSSNVNGSSMLTTTATQKPQVSCKVQI